MGAMASPDLTYINPGYQPGRFPIIGAGELPFPDDQRQGRHPGAGRLVSQIRGAEMKDVKFCLAFVHDPGAFRSRSKDCGA